MDFKNTLRKEIDKKLSGISTEEKHKLSMKLTENLVKSLLWKESGKIFLYLSFSNEVITDYIIQYGIESKKAVYAPVIDGNKMDFYRIDNLKKQDLVKNKYGILEPPKGLPKEYPCNEDIMLIPGVGFTLKGDRLGRGGGFYDRYLSLNTDIIKVGISFELQIYNEIPTEEWDVNLDYVLTEDKLYKTGGKDGNY